LEGCAVAAAEDLPIMRKMRDNAEPVTFAGREMPVEAYVGDILGLDLAGHGYANTGVMVMDLARWRTEDIAARCFAFLAATPGVIWRDQCAINHVLRGRFRRLDPRWNAFPVVARVYFPGVLRLWRRWLPHGRLEPRRPDAAWRAVLRQWLGDPWIVHFAGDSKPWLAGQRWTGFERAFWAAARRAPYGEALRGGHRKAAAEWRLAVLAHTLGRLSLPDALARRLAPLHPRARLLRACRRLFGLRA
jgi:hypothetical protein